MRDINLI